jgi:Putative adhesin
LDRFRQSTPTTSVSPPRPGKTKLNHWTIAIVIIGILIVGVLFSLIYYSTALVSSKTFSYSPLEGSYNSLSISDVDGLVTVLPWSQSSILINGTLNAMGLGSSLSSITLSNSTSNGNLIFKATFPASGGFLFSQTFTAFINVYVPSTTRFNSVQVTNVNGGVQLDSLNSTEVGVTTINGNVSVDCAYCVNATALSTNGNVTGTFVSLANKGSYNLTATNDNVNFTAPASSSFQLSATVLNGSIYCYMAGCPSTTVAAERTLTQSFNAGNATVNLDSLNGEITIMGT